MVEFASSTGDSPELTLHIWGDSLIPSQISDLLGVLPTKGFCKGERVVSVSGTAFNRKSGAWIFSTKNQVESNRLEDHWNLIDSATIEFRDSFLTIPGVTGSFLGCIIKAPIGSHSIELDLPLKLTKRLGEWESGIKLSVV